MSLSAAQWLVLLLAILLCAAGPPAHAAADAIERWSALTHTAFKHHNQADISAATSFAQDHSGFLWVGTQSGLVRWDGYRLRRYTANPQRPDALPNNMIMALHVDPAGRLWIGTSAGGLARYDAEADNFVAYPAGPAGLSSARVAALADDGNGGLWIGTGAGLDHMAADGALRQTARETATAGRAALPEGGVDALLLDRGGSLWIGTRNGLVRRDPGRQALSAVDLGAAALPALAINALFQDQAGRIWIGTRTAGAYLIAAGASAPAPVRETGPDASLHNERVASIAETGQGEVWLATEGANGGIVAVDPVRGTTRRIRHQPDAPDSLPDNDVYVLFRERSGVMYVGTMMALSQHAPQTAGVTTVRASGPGSSGKLSIPSMLVRPDGRVWLGVAGGAIDIIDPLQGAVGRLSAGQAGGSLPKGRVLAMANGPDGAVYIGTQRGLFRSDGGGRRVQRLAFAQRSASAAVYALAWAGDVLWIGGLDGLWGLSLAPGAAPRLLRHEDKRLGDSRITALLPVAGGDLWVGTRTGLARLDAASGMVETIPAHAAQEDRLAPGYVSSMLLDRHGKLWLSNFGAGIMVLDRTDRDGRRRFRRIGAAQGLKDSSVDCLVEAKDGMLWASTDSGLVRIDPSRFTVTALGAAEGVHVLSYWTNSGGRSANGELLFGGLSGLTVVHPDRLAKWTYQAPLAVTRILLNDKEIPSGRYNRAAPPGPIEVTPDGRERGFSLEFAALDYTAPERNLYAYRLTGFDAGWIQTDAASRRVSYTNLPPGDYTLQLRGTNREGAWSPPLAVPVRVLPAWHQQPWVRIGALLAALGLMAALVQARTAYLRRRQRELQTMVDLRTAELRATQSQLEKLAYADPLTGLPNRRLFNDDLRHMAAQAIRDGTSFTLLLIDLDHFKHINDSLGHDAGDALLVAAAARLRLSVREADRLSRLGGDEFAVLLSNTSDIAMISMICQRIVASMAEEIPYGQASMKISASVGAAIFHGNENAVEELYKAADLALYDAKDSGRNTWSLHTANRAARKMTV